MSIYLRDFVINLAKEKELKLHDHTKTAIRAIERQMEKDKKGDGIDVKMVINDLKKEKDLRYFNDEDWKTIEKEISRM